MRKTVSEFSNSCQKDAIKSQHHATDLSFDSLIIGSTAGTSHCSIWHYVKTDVTAHNCHWLNWLYIPLFEWGKHFPKSESNNYYIGLCKRFFYSFVLPNLDFILSVMGNAHFLSIWAFLLMPSARAKRLAMQGHPNRYHYFVNLNFAPSKAPLVLCILVWTLLTKSKTSL